MSDEKTFTQADIDAAIEKATGKVQESIDKLEAKNTELVADLRKARKTAEIKPEDLTAAEERADKAEAKASDLEKQVKTLTTERDKAVKSLEGESGFTAKLLIQDGIKSALLANGVKDEDFIDSLTSKFAAGASVVTEGDARKAMFGDKPLGDAIKAWAETDAGKKFVEAPHNSGGGAPGGKGAGGSGKTIAKADYDQTIASGDIKAIGAQAQAIREGATIVDQAA